MKTEIIILLISGGLLTLGAFLWQRGNHLLRHGKKATGIVFKNAHKGVGKTSSLYYPVVRFLTEDKEWITQELSIGYNPPMEEGTELTVVYDPDEPTTVEIDSSTQLELIPRLFVVTGLCGLVFVVLEFLEVVQMVE